MEWEEQGVWFSMAQPSAKEAHGLGQPHLTPSSHCDRLVSPHSGSWLLSISKVNPCPSYCIGGWEEVEICQETWSV